MTCKVIGKSLYQWDIGRQIEIIKPDEFDEIHFACEGDEEALVVVPKKDGDKLVADIPNIHLQRDGNVVLHIYIVKDDITIYNTSTTIYEREKPSDYFYEETEIKRYETLETKVDRFEKHNNELEKQIEDMGEKVDRSVEEFGERIDDVEQSVLEIDEVANTAKRVAEGAKSAVAFDTTAEMNEWLSIPENVASLRMGDNLFIRDMEVPDYWWDGEKPCELEAKTDLSDYVKNTDYATNNKVGLVRMPGGCGLIVASDGRLYTDRAQHTDIDKKTSGYRPITPLDLDYAVKKALADSKLAETVDAWTDEEKAAARLLLGAVGSEDYATNDKLGLVQANNTNYGVKIMENGNLATVSATKAQILHKGYGFLPIAPNNHDYAVKVGLTTNTETLTPEEQQSAKDWLGVNDTKIITEDSVRIWDLPTGTYEIPEGCVIYYNGATDTTKSRVSYSKTKLIIGESTSTYGLVYKHWYLFTTSNDVHGMVSIIGGSSTEESGSLHESPPLTYMTSRTNPERIDGAWTFTNKPKMTSELDATDNSEIIPNTKWVNELLDSGRGIKTIEPDENGELKSHIWDMESGIWYCPPTSIIYWKGKNYTDNISSGDSPNGFYLYITENSDKTMKIWETVSQNYVPGGQKGGTIKWYGSTTENAGFKNWVELGQVMMSKTEEVISGKKTFSTQPQMTAELPVDDNSNNIPTTKWVNELLDNGRGVKTIQPDSNGEKIFHVTQYDTDDNFMGYGLHIIDDTVKILNKNGVQIQGIAYGGIMLVYNMLDIENAKPIYTIYSGNNIYGLNYTSTWADSIFNSSVTSVITKPQTISAVKTFSAQPLITAEQTDFAESSDSIAKMSWVQKAIERAFGVFRIISGQKSGTTLGSKATAEGTGNTVSGNYAHAENQNNTADAIACHVEGYNNTIAEGADTSHCQGRNNKITTTGYAAHGEGQGNIVSSRYQHVQGKYNVEDAENKFAHIVGGGTSDSKRKNIHTIDWEGNAEFAGALKIAGTIIGATNMPHFVGGLNYGVGSSGNIALKPNRLMVCKTHEDNKMTIELEGSKSVSGKSLAFIITTVADEDGNYNYFVGYMNKPSLATITDFYGIRVGTLNKKSTYLIKNTSTTEGMYVYYDKRDY